MRKAKQREEALALRKARQAQHRLERFVGSTAATDAGTKTRERILKDGDDVLAFNAWDNVPWDESLEAEVAQRASMQPVAPAETVAAISAGSQASWELFYEHNLQCYKNRRYLRAEFPELVRLELEADEAGRAPRILEVGCGPGNTVLPLLSQFPSFRVLACDVSTGAVDLLRQHPSAIRSRCEAFVWDLVDAAGLPPSLPPESVDAVLLVFVLSALDPADFARALANVASALRPGGIVLFRDYGEGDLKQSKFTSKGMRLGDRWYARGNRTMVYFFRQREVDDLFLGAGLHPLTTDQHQARSGSGGGGSGAQHDKLLTVNRKTGQRMWRVWISGRFIKLRPE